MYRVMFRVAALSAALATVLGLMVPGPGYAHHTFTTKYDGAKKLTISGVVGSVKYSNPHIHFAVETSTGASWNVETEGVAVLQKHGITRDVLTEGAKVTITGWPGRDGSATLGLSSISVAKGPSAKIRGTAR
jgi:hypothetical protein